jgi:hypothetical protein
MTVVHDILYRDERSGVGMFRKRDPQSSLLETTWLLPPEKVARLAKTWAQPFRERALPLIEEEAFAPLFHEDNGRPNKPAQIVLGVLILKEMYDLTDEEALEQLEFNILWQHALRLMPEEAHLCQKTLHNFRAGLILHDGARLAFQRTTGRILEALDIRVDRQRLDSTHILSNFAILTRLGLFCETLRVALAALRRVHPKLFARVPEDLRRRYLKDDGTETRYRDAKSDQARRRVDVCARDAYRLLESLRGKAAAKLDEIRLLQRLFDDQCEVLEDERAPDASDDDAALGGAPVVVKEPKTISSASLQTPHDPDVTYSGHKGKGYEAQVAETCHEDNEAEFLTYVEVTPSCRSDDAAPIPALEDLASRSLQPAELVTDTTYGSAANAVKAAQLGTELVSPVGGTAKPESANEGPEVRPFTAADFKVDPKLETPAQCPAGHEATAQRLVSVQGKTVELHFDAAKCASCPLADRCPAKVKANAPQAVVRINLECANLEQRRRAEAKGEFRPRYKIRAGIEATNSELKRRHGFGKLRVRGKARVRLVVYLKALACNVKRMLGVLLRRSQLATVTG